MRLNLRKLASVSTVSALAIGAAALTGLTPANAATDGSGVVINEVYASGGSAGAPYTHKFVELANPTDADVDLSGWSLQYRKADGTGNATGIAALSGSIPAHGYYLVQFNSNGTQGAALPAADATSTVALQGQNGTIVLSRSASALNVGTGSVIGNPDVVDLIGYGKSNTFETAAAPTTSGNQDHRSRTRTNGVDIDNNSVDFTLIDAPTPCNTACARDVNATPETSTPSPTESPAPTETSTPTSTPSPTATATPTTAPSPSGATPITEIQGEGDTSPLNGQTVTTEGIVTAQYPTGGLNGFVIQMPTGAEGVAKPAGSASTGLFVYTGSNATLQQGLKIGDSVRVRGKVGEFNGQTQISASTVNKLANSLGTVSPTAIQYPRTDEEREGYESMLITLTDELTVTDNYNLNRFGEIGLAIGSPLVTPTDVGAPGSPEAVEQAISNASRAVTLDDGATTNYMSGPGAGTPIPYIDIDRPVTVGATATLTKPVILGYSFQSWRLNPTVPVNGTNPADEPVSFEQVREETVQYKGNDFTIATFNVLNYFTALGEDHCSSSQNYKDRQGNPVTANGCLPRGAWNAENLQRQQAKIVAAINEMDADVVGLEEVENSARFGKDRDQALATLTAALNAAAGSDKWAYVRSPGVIPESGSDVIRTAFIYQPESVETVGESRILDNPNFKNARAPLAQTFREKVSGQTFNVIVNHFKSKGGSGTGDNENPDQKVGPEARTGGWNGDRTRQAQALVQFAREVEQAAGTNVTFLVGDFNSYAKETPVTTIEQAGYEKVHGSTGTKASHREHSYLFGGQVGSLDHIFASAEAQKYLNGTDIWTINAYESIAYEYTRHNYNVEQFYTPDVYRSSDHNPGIVRLQFPEDEPNLPETERVAGNNRYLTSVELSKRFSTPGKPVFIVAGESYPDALAAGPAAASVDGAILLALPNRLLPETKAEIQRLNPSEVFIIGSEKTLSAQVEAQVRQASGTAPVTRIAGADRIDTSVKIAERFFPDAERALLATGWNYPDALSASSGGTLAGIPVLLTTGDKLNPRVEAYLKRSTVTHVDIVGSPRSVSDDAKRSALSAKPDMNGTRIGGDNRYATNSLVNQTFGAFATGSSIVVATGERFPDALTASIAVNATKSPLVLTTGTCVVEETSEYLAARVSTHTVIVGSTDAVRDDWRENICK